MSTIAPLRPSSPAGPALAPRPTRQTGPARPTGPASRPGARPGTRRTRRPARGAARSGIAFAILVLSLLVGALVAVLMLNTVIAQDAFVRTDLLKQQRILHDREQELRQQVAEEEAPQRLAARAAALGMVPSRGPAFLRLHDAKILGVAEAATQPAPVVGYQPPAPRAAQHGTPTSAARRSPAAATSAKPVKR